ncbi:MAG: hypothetical protein A2W23_02735 [Planctomycetes bacterium RBG_16_43_13]|nr:MAG: hypothetical protein A2W23_02735 [Planctomycetes bacterium RBG_16_43_13]
MKVFAIALMVGCLSIFSGISLSQDGMGSPQDKGGEDKENLQKRIVQLVKDLDDNNQKTRINATEELIKIGEPALEDVKKALIKPPNNEVRIRAKYIVSEIEFKILAKKFKIAFLSYRGGNREIYIMDADGSNVKRMTNNKATDDSPAWSPAAAGK